MLGASINYPLRGAVTWKSIVGTNVAADALSNLSSPGVIGGAMIILGEDYGEGASVIQERSYAYAMKSSMWLLDPRPDLPTIVRMVEKGFELSEASHAPVMLELRIRACHVTGAVRRQGQPPRREFSGLNRLAGPPRFNYGRLAHPPVTFVQEKLKVEERLPAAQRLHPRAQAQRGHRRRPRRDRHHRDGRPHQRRAARAGAARPRRPVRHLARPDLVLNVVYPLVPEELREFCAGKRAVLVVEEGHPDYIEQADQRRAAPRRHPDPRSRQGTAAEGRRIHLRRAAARASPASSARRGRPGSTPTRSPAKAESMLAHKRAGRRRGSATLPPRPPTFCTGCPERPVFAAHQADAARARADPYQRRHRLPFVRDLRAVLARQLDPRLRHVARQRRRGRRPTWRGARSR